MMRKTAAATAATATTVDADVGWNRGVDPCGNARTPSAISVRKIGDWESGSPLRSG
jgi:hypothetical protein